MILNITGRLYIMRFIILTDHTYYITRSLRFVVHNYTNRPAFSNGSQEYPTGDSI